MIRAISPAICAMVLAFSGATAYAQPIPPGSYQQSCNAIRIEGGQLIASCSATNGGRIVSSIGLGCRGDIGNVNGSLRCNGGGPGAGHRLPGDAFGPRPGAIGRLPAGSYRQSCSGARLIGTVLSASCTSPNGARVTSSLNVARCRGNADIGNRSGYLFCNR